MKNLVAVLALVTFVVGCTEDRVTVFHNNDRVTELERRANLNDQLNALQNQRLDALEAALALETEARQEGDLNLSQDIVDLDEELRDLTTRVNNLESDLDALETEVAQLAADMAGINASLQAQLDQQGVQLFKCDSPSSTERIMKINGKFYAVMNRVTTKNVQVVTGSSSTTVTTPDMCETFLGHLELPNSGGQCTPNSGPFKSTKIPGQTITVPSYTTATVKVVDSVKIALDILTDGGYTVTDAGSCSFSISGGGTVATNLIPVQ